MVFKWGGGWHFSAAAGGSANFGEFTNVTLVWTGGYCRHLQHGPYSSPPTLCKLCKAEDIGARSQKTTKRNFLNRINLEHINPVPQSASTDIFPPSPLKGVRPLTGRKAGLGGVSRRRSRQESARTLATAKRQSRAAPADLLSCVSYCTTKATPNRSKRGASVARLGPSRHVEVVRRNRFRKCKRHANPMLETESFCSNRSCKVAGWTIGTHMSKNAFLLLLLFGLLTFLLRLGVEGKQTEPRGGGALISETREERERETTCKITLKWSHWDSEENTELHLHPWIKLSLGFVLFA
ncbi:hypothetical protein ACE6H2_028305 [Prunus campanulata]